MKRWILALVVYSSLSVCAQYYTPNLREQCIAVVPLTGKGTPNDPIRPMYLPVGRQNRQDITAIESYTWQMTDDKKSAVVHIYARDKAAFRELLKDPRVKAFVKGKDNRETVEREIKAHLKDFRMDDPQGVRKAK